MTETEAHAKINLRHRVFGRDETGYHGVETILSRTSLTDTLRLEETSAGIEIEIDGPRADGIPTGPDNLCWAAAERFFERAFPGRRARPGVRFGLTKRIPSESGLGGGSADAAAALRLLAERWGRLEERDLIAISGDLGSDVTFALLDCPMALGWERGRRLLPLRPPPPRPALLLTPPVSVATPEAYAWLRETREREPDPGGASVLPGVTRLAEWEPLARLVRNDLAAPVFARTPELRAGLERMSSGPTTATGMTGSGSTLFAIFPDEKSRAAIGESIGQSGLTAAQGWEVFEVRLPV